MTKITSIHSNKMSNKMLYIPNNSDYPNSASPLVEFVKDLETKKRLLKDKYNNKLRDLQDQVYSHQRDDIILKEQLDNEIKNYLKTDEENFLKIRMAHDQELRRLNDQNIEFERKTLENKKNVNYTSVKSHYNDLDIALLPHNIDGSYQLTVNNKCLSVQDQDNYALVMCDKYDNTQRFVVSTIDNDASYYDQYKLNPTGKPSGSFPYNLVKSSLSGACLESQDDGLYMKPCKDVITQRWNASDKNKMKC
jgi:hypothetical protein